MEVTKMERKQFSEVQKRLIAYRQNWCCTGELCKGQKSLGPNWNLDHIRPLFLGGSNEDSNVQILCPGCHALKTQTERITFFEIQRKPKVNKQRIGYGERCSIYLNKDKNKLRWRVCFGKTSSFKSKYFSNTKYGSLEIAKQYAVDWCNSQGIFVNHISP